MADLSLIPAATWGRYLKLAEATVCRFRSLPDWE